MKLGISITMLIHNKDDIEFVTEFPCFLGHPVANRAKELYTVHCGRNVNKPSVPTEVEGKGLQLRCDIKVQQKTS